MEIRVEGVSFMIELRRIFWVFMLEFYWKNKCSVFNQIITKSIFELLEMQDKDYLEDKYLIFSQIVFCHQTPFVFLLELDGHI